MGKVSKRRNVGFKSQKQRDKLNKFVESVRRRWGKSPTAIDEPDQADDHSYVRENNDCVPNLADVADDVVVVEEEGREQKDWGKGRRIIELDVLADGLKGCRFCGNPLRLHHASSITTHGIGAMLKGLVSTLFFCFYR